MLTVSLVLPWCASCAAARADEPAAAAAGTASMAAAVAGPGEARSEPPAGLSCLCRFYALRAERHQGRWWGVLPDGRRLPWAGDPRRSLDQRLAAPTLQDLFAIPYRRGPLHPVTRENDDPGRIRSEPLLAATYGEPVAAADLVRLRFAGQPVVYQANRRPTLKAGSWFLPVALVASTR